MPPRRTSITTVGPRAAVGAAQAVNGSSLSEGEIVHAARELVSEAGVDGLTMRALSAKLGVALGATYHHVPNKRDLLLLVAHELYDEVVLPEKGTWDQRLKKLMVSVAEVVGRHPGMASFMNSNAADSMPVELNRQVTDLLSEAGFSSRNVHAVMGALFIYVNGVISSGFGRVAPRVMTVDVSRIFRDGLEMLLTGARARLEEDLDRRSRTRRAR